MDGMGSSLGPDGRSEPGRSWTTDDDRRTTTDERRLANDDGWLGYPSSLVLLRMTISAPCWGANEEEGLGIAARLTMGGQPIPSLSIVTPSTWWLPFCAVST